MASNPESYSPFFYTEKNPPLQDIPDRGEPPTRLLEEHPEVLELPHFKEQWLPTFDVFTISGHPGSGKTLQAMALAYCYNIELVTPSQKFRAQIEEMGQQVRSGVKRPEEMDKELDTYQKDLIHKAVIENNSLFLESRLGGVLATEYLLESEKKKKRNSDFSEPRIIRGLWIANREVRAERVGEREGVSIAQARRDNTDREVVDFKIWREHHQKLLKGVKDVYDPCLVYKPHKKGTDRLHGPKGQHYLYDFAINTSKDSFVESFLKTHEILVRTGGVIRLDDYREPTESDPKDFNPKGGDIAVFA